MRYMRCLFIGRFQPFHLGHMKIVDDILDEENKNELIIAIGSAQKSHTVENPFTAGERIQMIKKTLSDIQNTIYIVPIPDVERNSIWVSHLESLCPKFNIVYSNNPLVKQLFKESGKEIKSFPLYKRDQFQGTEIRRKILRKQKWKHLVPDKTAEIIEQIDGKNRLKNINKNDT